MLYGVTGKKLRQHQSLATRCNMLQHAATRCNTLQHDMPDKYMRPAPVLGHTLQHAATRGA